MRESQQGRNRQGDKDREIRNRSISQKDEENSKITRERQESDEGGVGGNEYIGKGNESEEVEEKRKIRSRSRHERETKGRRERTR